LKVFVSDCEGPISKNDNAYELASRFIPNGERLFTVISRYDDVLADIVKRAGYKAGDTLKLILPFLKAYGVTDQAMLSFSFHSVVLIPGTIAMLKHVASIATAFIVSTSYEHYMKALCKITAFPCENTYCTKLELDKYSIGEKERTRLKEFTEEISQMPVAKIPSRTQSISDLSVRDRDNIERLDVIFWDKIAGMDVGRIYNEVNPIGGSEKVGAIRDVVNRVGSTLSSAVYVGDSITDEDALNLVRENDGLAISFNGNRYAVENSDVAVLSANNLVTAVLADAFCKFGKQQTLRLAENWSRETLEKSEINKKLLNDFFRTLPQRLPKVKIVTNENIQTLARISSGFRKKIRGEAVGGLG